MLSRQTHFTFIQPNRYKVWVPGQKLDARAQKNWTATAEPLRPCVRATSPLCKRLQESQQRQQDYNKGVEDGGWTDVEPRKTRYVTGRFDDGRVFAKIILQ